MLAGIEFLRVEHRPSQSCRNRIVRTVHGKRHFRFAGAHRPTPSWLRSSSLVVSLSCRHKDADRQGTSGRRFPGMWSGGRDAACHQRRAIRRSLRLGCCAGSVFRRARPLLRCDEFFLHRRRRLAQVPGFVRDRQTRAAALADADVHVSRANSEDHLIRQADRAAWDQLARIR